ncbi:putative protein OS=Streptomyces griseomycini OX=66895 GN=FHS37_006746 PE=4 SV=1 [Streptomyces griseomycini]|uniref:Uncharacterized protein n=1 Tax=Streptomyces griseomycini TaxID=66895 RepID=A0A7W7PWM8_9ACTN|nr:hypothetical protein [Streptomyces griseomycini]
MISQCRSSWDQFGAMAVGHRTMAMSIAPHLTGSRTRLQPFLGSGSGCPQGSVTVSVIVMFRAAAAGSMLPAENSKWRKTPSWSAARCWQPCRTQCPSAARARRWKAAFLSMVA